jgi:hypothetical protein
VTRWIVALVIAGCASAHSPPVATAPFTAFFWDVDAPNNQRFGDPFAYLADAMVRAGGSSDSFAQAVSALEHGSLDEAVAALK